MKNKIILVLLILLIFIFNITNINMENIFQDIIYLVNAKENKIVLSDTYKEEEFENRKKEINDLKELLDIEVLSNYNVVYATVINRTNEYFYDELTINKGSIHNIKENSIVITKNGLLGKIIKVNKNNSIVKLITSKDVYNMLSVQINMKDKYVYGILKSYDENSNSFNIEGIDENINILENSNVTTTGLGLYPSGILIGRVVRIQKDNFDLSSIVKVEPYIDFNNIRYVGVLISNV